MTLPSAPEAVRRFLEAKHLELAAEFPSYDGIQVIRTADEIDSIRLAVEREMATADLERRSILMRQIADALVRLGNGEYGLCVRCGVEIPAERLRWVPWTPYCLRCQETTEREHPRRIGQQTATLRYGDDPL